MNPPPPEPPDLDDLPTPETRDRQRRELEHALLIETMWDPTPDLVLAAAEPEDFNHGTYRRLWESMRQARSDGAPLEYATVADVLEARGDLAKVGGIPGVIAALSAERSLWSSAAWLAAKVHDTGRRERLAQAGRKVAAMAASGEVDLSAVEAELKPLQPMPDRGITGPWDVRDQLLSRLEHPELLEGLRTGWADVDRLYRVDPGQLTVVTGIPGSGKSTWLDNVLVRMAERHDWRIAVFSPESAPTARHVGRIAGIHAGTHPSRLGRANLDQAIDWADGHLRWIESTDAVTLTEVLRRADVVRRHFGRLDGLVVDPWNELDHARPDSIAETQHISASLTALRRWGRKHLTHVWIVAHPKKLEKRASGFYPAPALYDISGSSTWNDKADMGVVVHRDKLNPGPVEIHIVKVRFDDHGQLGTARLVFDPPSATYGAAAPDWRQPA